MTLTERLPEIRLSVINQRAFLSALGNGAELLGRMVEYIDEKDFEICGDAYKEYPLNEISVANEKDYLIRILIAVREKQALMTLLPPLPRKGNELLTENIYYRPRNMVPPR